MAETCSNEFEEYGQHFVWNERLVVNLNPQDGRVYVGGGVEGPSGDLGFDARFAIHLHAQCEQAQVAGGGTDAFCHFLLAVKNDAARFCVAFEQVAYDRRSNVVMDICCDDVVGLIYKVGDV